MSGSSLVKREGAACGDGSFLGNQHISRLACQHGERAACKRRREEEGNSYFEISCLTKRHVGRECCLESGLVREKVSIVKIVKQSGVIIEN